LLACCRRSRIPHVDHNRTRKLFAKESNIVTYPFCQCISVSFVKIARRRWRVDYVNYVVVGRSVGRGLSSEGTFVAGVVLGDSQHSLFGVEFVCADRGM